MTTQKKETPTKEVSLPTKVIENKDLVKFDPERDIAQAEAASKALMKLIDKTKPLILNNKRYLYFEHWQTIGRFFGYTVGIEWTKKLETGYEARALLYDQVGRIVGGAEASCLKDENNWKQKPDFQLRSMAQTRAMAKALRSNFGSVAVLAGLEATPAEEMNGDKNLTSPEPSKQSNEPLSPAQKEYLKALIEKKGKLPRGYTVKGLKDLNKISAVSLISKLEKMPNKEKDESPLTPEQEAEI